MAPGTPTTPSTSALCASLQTDDFASVKSIGMHSGFGDNNTTRLRCYSILLGCGRLDIYDKCNEGRMRSTLAGQATPNCPKDTSNLYSKLIGRDVKRNGYSRWDKTADYSECQKDFDLSQIQKLLNTVFSENRDFNYIQSMDSIFALFYLISNGKLSVAKQLIVSYLNIFKSDLSLTHNNFGQLSSMWSILRSYDAGYSRWIQHRILKHMGDDVSFALEWYISWFCHTSINDYSLILRVYDFMIATQHQHVGLYMVVAVLLCNKRKIMANVCNQTDFMLYVRNEIVFDSEMVDALIAKCNVVMSSEMKKERRANAWKHNKLQVTRKWNVIKKKVLSSKDKRK